MSHHFPIIILNGRPAAGKSEVIDYLKKTPDAERLSRFNVGPFEEIDDFPYVWEMFEMDDILARHGRQRLFTTKDYYFQDDWLWNFLIERINLDYLKKVARQPDFLKDYTIILEFARANFREAYEMLHPEILKQAGIFYIQVSYEESVRKNRRHHRPDQEDSILYHSLPDEKMEYYYRTNDWDELAQGKLNGTMKLKGMDVPFTVLPNEPEVTDSPAKLGPAVQEAFNRLKQVWKR